VPERVLCAAAALVLLYLEPVTVVTGLVLLAVALAVHLVLRRSPDRRARP
jgi:Flp pilus assembly protein TadB